MTHTLWSEHHLVDLQVVEPGVGDPHPKPER